jgi:hypothetical protein
MSASGATQLLTGVEFRRLPEAAEGLLELSLPGALYLLFTNELTPDGLQRRRFRDCDAGGIHPVNVCFVQDQQRLSQLLPSEGR